MEMIPPDSIPSSCPVCGGARRATSLGQQCPACVFGLALAPASSIPEGGERWFGKFCLKQELGRGSMGVVWRAFQQDLGRHVALKTLSIGVFADPVFLQRFQQEAMAAARLAHPGIAMVLEVGEAEHETFFTMELVEGGTLAERFEKAKLTHQQAAELVESVARAVAFAHGQGVLHRDLKPSNILLDREGRPKVADFGLALAVEDAEDRQIARQAVGTPAYMAPEVANGARGGVAADVFSLGAVLYEALAGRPLYHHVGTRATLIAAQSGEFQNLRQLVPTLSPDLAAICMKCLRREAGERYETMAALAEDLRRFLDGRTVLARPGSAVDEVWSWARRNRGTAILSGVVLVGMIAGTIAVFQQAAVTQRQAEALEIVKIANEQGTQELAKTVYLADMRAAGQAIVADHLMEARSWLEKHSQNPDRGPEWSWMVHQVRSEASAELLLDAHYISAIGFSPDGQRLAIGRAGATPMSYDLAEGKWSELPGDLSSPPVFALSQQPLVIHDGVLDLGNHQFPAASVRISSDGGRAALCSVRSGFYAPVGGEISIVDLETGTQIWKSEAGAIGTFALDGAGRHLASSGPAGGVIVREVDSGKIVNQWQGPPSTWLEFSPDGAHLASAEAGALRLLELASGKAENLFFRDGETVTCASFSPDGKFLATSCTDGLVRVWALGAAEPLVGEFRGHESEVWCLAWRPDGKALASGGRDGRVLLWLMDNLPVEPPLIPARFQRPIFAPDSRSLLTAAGNGAELQASRWALADARPLGTFPLLLQAQGIARDGDAVMWNPDLGRIEWWPPLANAPARILAIAAGKFDNPCQLSLSPDGTKFALVDNSGLLTFFPSSGNGTPRELPLRSAPPAGEKYSIRDVAWSPAGDQLAVAFGTSSHEIVLVDTRTFKQVVLLGNKDDIAGLAFAPTGTMLASGSVDGAILIYDFVHPSAVPRRLAGHFRSTVDLAFSPDGHTLLSLGTLEGVKFWNIATWREIAFMPIPDAASHMAISPDGAWLAITCGTQGQPERVRLFPLR